MNWANVITKNVLCRLATSALMPSTGQNQVGAKIKYFAQVCACIAMFERRTEG